MKTVILDYSEAKVKILEHEEMQIEDMEELLYGEYGLKENNVEWMTVDEVEIEDLSEKKYRKPYFPLTPTRYRNFPEESFPKKRLRKYYLI